MPKGFKAAKQNIVAEPSRAPVRKVEPRRAALSGEHAITYQLGCVIRVLARTERRRFRLASVEAQIAVPLKLGQLQVIFDSRGQPEGYAVWAFVTEAVAEQLRQDPDRLLHFSEWNEGINLWLIDFVAPNGAVWRMYRACREALGGRSSVAFSARATRNGMRSMRFKETANVCA